MRCDRCSNETTVTKSFNRKDGTGTFTKYVCTSGCKDEWKGKYYQHTFFPPKAQAGSQETTQILKQILSVCQEIKAKLPAGQYEPMDTVPPADQPEQVINEEEPPF